MNSKNKVPETLALTQRLPRSAQAIWQLLRSGHDMHKVLPSLIEACQVEGSGPGARRVCMTKQGPLDETILCADDGARLFRYRIDKQSVMPLDHYEGSVHVVELGANECQVLWFATYDLRDPSTAAQVRDGLTGILSSAIQGLGALAAG